MVTEMHNGRETSVTGLLSGIISDLADLVKQQLAMFRQEAIDELRKSRDAAKALIAGVVIGAIGVSLLTLTLVHLLAWATPIPLWGCYGIVGGCVTIAGATLYFAGRRQFQSFSPVPNESLRALKENVHCLTAK